MKTKDVSGYMLTIAVMERLLEEVKKDCQTEGWRKGYKGSNGKKPVLDRLLEIRRLALGMSNKVKSDEC